MKYPYLFRTSRIEFIYKENETFVDIHWVGERDDSGSLRIGGIIFTVPMKEYAEIVSTDTMNSYIHDYVYGKIGLPVEPMPIENKGE